jgi:integral membrane protein
MTKTPAALYKLVAAAEMVTWGGLILAMIARYGFGYDGGLFFVAGLSHGIVFLAYGITAIVIGINLRWGFGSTTMAVSMAIVPFATLPFDRWLLRHHKLEGAWRTTATIDPAPRAFWIACCDFGWDTPRCFLRSLWWVSEP